MTGADAFISTICQAPHEDAPRLVYADWLEERGDPRAEFIRVQVELAGLREPEWLTHGNVFQLSGNELIRDHCVACQASQDDLCRWHTLTPRSDELLATNRREWTMAGLEFDKWDWFKESDTDKWFVCFMPHKPHDDSPHMKFDFRRGFPELLTCRWEEWAAHHEAMRRAMPVTKVMLTTWPDASDLCKFAQVHFGQGSPGNRINRHLELLRAEWPGIEFVLPRPDLVAMMAERIGRRVAEDVERRILGLDVADGLDATVMAVTMRRGPLV